MLLDDDGGVGVEAGPERALGVGDVDLGAERPVLGVERPGGPGHLALEVLAGEGLEADQGPVAGVDRGGIHLGHAHGDPHEVVAGHGEERLALACRARSGRRRPRCDG